MNIKKNENVVVPIDPEKLNRLILKITELAEKYGDNINVEKIEEILDIVSFFDDTFRRGTSDAGDFFTMADIEQLILEEGRLLQDANLKNLFRGMKKLAAEETIIAQKKTSLGNKGRKSKSGGTTQTP
jgi:hypothetical protein